MTSASTREDAGETDSHHEPPPVVVIVSILAIVLMLMAFSLAAAWLGSTALAAVAGTGAVGLGTEAVRRLLAHYATRRGSRDGG